METWTVVKFIDEDLVEAVSTSWILGNKCYWPTYSTEKVLASIKKQDKPNTCWPLHTISIFRNATYDTYLKAREKSNKAVVNSDLNTDEEKATRHRRRIRAISPETSSDSDNEICATNSNNFSLSLSPPPEMPVSQPLQSNVSTSQTGCSCCTEHKIGEKLDNIYKQQVLIKNLIAQLVEQVELLKIQKTPILQDQTKIESIFVKLSFFPINNTQDLDTLETFLEEEEHFMAAMHEISRIGGNGPYEFIKRVMSRIISNNLAAQYSWLGAKRKMVFSQLKMAKLIIGAAETNNISADAKQTEEAIKKWLRRAKERDENFLKRTRQHNE